MICASDSEVSNHERDEDIQHIASITFQANLLTKQAQLFCIYRI